jgi:hypothetical protein
VKMVIEKSAVKLIPVMLKSIGILKTGQSITIPKTEDIIPLYFMLYCGILKPEQPQSSA